MLTVCLKAGLFLLEKAATVALKKKESNIGIQLHRRDISFLDLSCPSDNCSTSKSFKDFIFVMNLGRWSITKLATFAMHRRGLPLLQQGG